jgi:hypothetical protein
LLATSSEYEIQIGYVDQGVVDLYPADTRVKGRYEMLIKKADDKAKDIEVLQGLLTHPDASVEIKRKIEQEIRNIQSGIRGEADTAYELDFYYGPSKNWAVIHDLRIEHKGRVAQIDHLLVNRFLDVWICESKRFSEGIAINEQGECAMFWNSKPQGIGSPHEQNTKHIAVVKAACEDGAVDLPKRLGFSIKPTFSGLIVVSKNARISRPKTKGWWNDSIVKADAVKTKIEKSIDSDSNILMAAKIVSSETLKDFARQLASLHAPVAFDWHARFGLPVQARPKEVQVTESQNASPGQLLVKADAAVATPSLAPVAEPAEAKKSKLICVSCGTSVQYNVAKFCWFNKEKFGGKVFCFDCQKQVAQPTA